MRLFRVLPALAISLLARFATGEEAASPPPALATSAPSAPSAAPEGELPRSYRSHSRVSFGLGTSLSFLHFGPYRYPSSYDEPPEGYVTHGGLEVLFAPTLIVGLGPSADFRASLDLGGVLGGGAAGFWGGPLADAFAGFRFNLSARHSLGFGVRGGPLLVWVASSGGLALGGHASGELCPAAVRLGDRADLEMDVCSSVGLGIATTGLGPVFRLGFAFRRLFRKERSPR